MKKLLAGESGQRATIVDVAAKTVVVTHCWKRDRTATRYQLEYTYSFDVSEAEVYRLAALWVNKDFQNRMRVEQYNEKELTQFERDSISVKEMYAKKERGPRDPKKAAATAMSKLNAAEQAEILAMFNAVSE